jgi:3-hydroxybutyryl-CoA dehydrogenase
MHFFNPVWAMHLVEVIRGTATSQVTLDEIESIVEFLGMEQALINDSPGFATSRLGILVGIEAIPCDVARISASHGTAHAR